MPETFHVSLPARLSKIRELSRMVEEFGDANGLSQQRVFVMNLALDERRRPGFAAGSRPPRVPSMTITSAPSDIVCRPILHVNGTYR